MSLSFVSPIVVDSDFTTLYPGEEGKITLEIENNENFDIEDVSIRLILEEVPFTSVGSSEKDADDIREDKDEDVSFTLRPSTDIVPGDYNIPYEVTFYDEDDDETPLKKTGSFGIRVSARTDIDFSVYTSDNAIVGKNGEITFEIVNKGLGEIKSVLVEVFPQGYDLLSKEKIFIGSVDPDDTEIATFDVIFNSPTPVLKVDVNYKDFDNNEHSELVSLPFKVYTTEEATQLGLIGQGGVGTYIIIVIILIIVWIIYRQIKKRRRRNNKKKNKSS